MYKNSIILFWNCLFSFSGMFLKWTVTICLAKWKKWKAETAKQIVYVKSAFLDLIFWNCRVSSSLSFLILTSRCHWKEDDHSLLNFFFDHCLIQLDSKAILSLEHTQNLTLAILHIIKHDKDYNSCLIHYHGSRFTPILLCL